MYTMVDRKLMGIVRKTERKTDEYVLYFGSFGNRQDTKRSWVCTRILCIRVTALALPDRQKGKDNRSGEVECVIW